MKKIISILLLLTLALGIFTGCNGESANADSKKLRIVTTIFPEYDWVKQIMGDNKKNADISFLLESGVDLHSYRPSVQDIAKISTCDMFIYVGGESDGWVKDAVANATNKNMVVINLMELLKDHIKEEEVVEGMQGEEEDEDKKDDDKEVEYDEHVWLSVRNAKAICKEIASKLGELDSENKDTYTKNYDAYATKLDALDTDYKNVIDNKTKDAILFGDRFPFRYMVDDYGLQYYAAFVGCSAETEASFETISFLANKVDELSLNSIVTIEGKTHKIAETIVENTKNKNQKILTLDSMQSTKGANADNGANYIDIMTKNLDVIKQALN